jgi:hypothetical protein
MTLDGQILVICYLQGRVLLRRAAAPAGWLAPIFLLPVVPVYSPGGFMSDEILARFAPFKLLCRLFNIFVLSGVALGLVSRDHVAVATLHIQFGWRVSTSLKVVESNPPRLIPSKSAHRLSRLVQFCPSLHALYGSRLTTIIFSQSSMVIMTTHSG